ncbi:MAG: DNA polymerase IV [Clostridiales bacterium]|nr:DNA polymerase IV [Clostridiales bacterium]
MRTILHSDLNNFYASVEIMKNPDLKDVPLVVTGSVEDRHGIVLAKNQLAKSFGVKTGEVLWQARKKCAGNLVSVLADFPSYYRVSKAVKSIYARYTDHIESFGIDECWLDVTDSLKIFGSGEKIAEEIRAAVKSEIGVTVSIGVSFNKIFAKLGSDMKKPDAVTVINQQNYKDTVWKLPASDLLYVGRATAKKLDSIGIHTIGDIARTDRSVLTRLLGVWGKTLHVYANGQDDTPVVDKEHEEDAKSIGNSLTDYKDLVNVDEVKTLILMLSETVAARLRKSGLGKACTVRISVTDNQLNTCGKQTRLMKPTSSSIVIAHTCYDLFESLYKWEHPVRGVGVSVANFTQGLEQLTFDSDPEKERKVERLDSVVDTIRSKYGNNSVRRATILQDKKLSDMDLNREEDVKPFDRSPFLPDDEN